MSEQVFQYSFAELDKEMVKLPNRLPYSAFDQEEPEEAHIEAIQCDVYESSRDLLLDRYGVKSIVIDPEHYIMSHEGQYYVMSITVSPVINKDSQVVDS